FLVALEAAILERRPGGATRGLPLESGLVGLLADLLRAALAWEAEYGLPTGQEQSHGQERSVGMPNAVHWSRASSAPLRLLPGGREDGNVADDGKQERTPGFDV
ncbi:MAG: hypothetical protein V1724_00795, partial [Chloroflexota bacterium]